jgi:hypothetical protein
MYDTTHLKPRHIAAALGALLLVGIAGEMLTPAKPAEGWHVTIADDLPASPVMLESTALASAAVSSAFVETDADKRRFKVAKQVSADRAIYAARDAVRAVLRNPRGAQFSTERYMPSTGAVCGLVNAQNGWGGFTGRVSYVIADGRLHYADIAAYTRWC